MMRVKCNYCILEGRCSGDIMGLSVDCEDYSDWDEMDDDEEEGLWKEASFRKYNQTSLDTEFGEYEFFHW